MVLKVEQANMLAVIDDSLTLAESTKKQYKKALVSFWAAGGKITDIGFLTQYAKSLSKSGRCPGYFSHPPDLAGKIRMSW
jgi:hypothetical protein